MSISPPLPNFDRAEFHGDPPAPDQCAYCHRGITTEYYRVDGNLACAACAQQAEDLVPPDSHKAYSRAVLFGVGAAIVGCTGYSLVTIITGWTIGYAAIGVGYLVGNAMKMGSRGLGGKRYQITAALLTYAAVAMAFIPIAIHQMNAQEKEKKTSAPQVTTAPASSVPPTTITLRKTDSTVSPAVPDAPPAVAAPVTAAQPAEKQASSGFAMAMLTLLGLGLVSPFLELMSSPAGGLLGLFIIFIGISTAWRLTHREASQVDGPYEQAPSQ